MLVSSSYFIEIFGSAAEGTLTSEYGRISNIDEHNIHVAAALTQSHCIRECVDFKKNYPQYYNEDCYAYNYDIDNKTCELIHSTEPTEYTVDIQLRWKTGFKILS